MCKNLKSILLMLILSTFSIAMDINNLSQAVDIAGKQRMFTQKMLKDYAMIGLNNKFGNPSEDLKNIIIKFEEHLKGLMAFNKEPKTKKSLDKVMSLWKEIKVSLSQTPSKEKAKALQESLDALLKEANEATALFTKQTGKLGDIVNISGRQIMLSQRMAALYMLKVWGISEPKFSEQMTKAMNTFKSSSQRLSKSKMNTAQIKKLLNETMKSFMFFEIMNKSKSKFIPSLIYKKSNDILKAMDKVTALYAEEEKK